MTSAIYRKYKDKECCNIEVNLKNRTIKLPKLKEVEIRGYRNLDKINGSIINATISREVNGKYYVSVMCEIPEVKQIIPSTIVGIDLGIKKHLTLSDTTTYDNNKYIEKYEKRIKRIQRELSRKEKGKHFYQVDTYFPSSQLCSLCNNKDTQYKNLNERNYYCTHCHNQLDRDLNVSINVMFEGLRLYMNEVYA